MEKYYFDFITKCFSDLVKGLLTAIAYYFEDCKMEWPKEEKRYGNEVLLGIEIALDENGRVNAWETEATFRVFDEDGEEMEMVLPLKKVSVDWLKIIYEELSKKKITFKA